MSGFAFDSAKGRVEFGMSYFGQFRTSAIYSEQARTLIVDRDLSLYDKIYLSVGEIGPGYDSASVPMVYNTSVIPVETFKRSDGTIRGQIKIPFKDRSDQSYEILIAIRYDRQTDKVTFTTEGVAGNYIVDVFLEK